MSTSYESDYVKELNDCLFDLRMPELKVREAGSKPSTSSKDAKSEVTVALLSRAPGRLAMVMEGGAQHREGVFLVLSHEWLERRGGDLFLKKGAWFAPATEQFYLDSYEPARKVTYFANFFTDIASKGQRKEGIALEDGLECPHSLGHHFEGLANDRIFARTVLARGKVSFPRTLALSFQSKRKYGVDVVNKERLRVLALSSTDEAAAKKVSTAVTAFAAKLPPHVTRISVKHGGPSRQETSLAHYFGRHEVNAASAYAMSVLKDCKPGDCVVVEEFLNTMPPQQVSAERDIPLSQSVSLLRNGSALPLMRLQEDLAEAGATSASEDEGDESGGGLLADDVSGNAPVTARALSMVVRVVTSLDNGQRPQVATSVCMFGPAHSPLHDEVELPHSLHATLRRWGLAEETERKRLEERLFNEAKRVHAMMAEALEQLRATAAVAAGKDAGDAATLAAAASGAIDMMATDFVLAQQGSLVVPTVLRVHDHDALDLVQRFEEVHNLRGHSVRLWVERALTRSQDYTMRGRVLVVVGASGYGKLDTWDMLLGWGLKLVVIDSIPDHMCKSRVWKYLHFPELDDHEHDAENAKKIVELLKTEGGFADPAKEIDGVETIYDGAHVVCAMVAHLLGKKSNHPRAHEIAKDKFQMADTLTKAKHRSSLLPEPQQYAGLSIQINSEADIRAALEGEKAPMPLPCLLKLVGGMCGCGVKLVTTVQEAIDEFNGMDERLRSTIGGDSSGLSFSNQKFLMEYLDGTEHDIDICMYDGDLICAIVSDNGPTRLPFFNEVTSASPSRLPREEVEAMVAGAETMCRAVGLNNGVFDVEMKYTSSGAKLIEVNARIGGFYLLQISERLYDCNYLRLVVLCALGIRPIVRKKILKSDVVMVGTHLFEHAHGRRIKPFWPPVDERKLTKEEQKKQHKFRWLQEQGVMMYTPYMSRINETGPEWAEPIAHISCEAKTHMEAGKKLVNLIRTLGIDDDAPVKTEYFLAGMGAYPLDGNLL